MNVFRTFKAVIEAERAELIVPSSAGELIGAFRNGAPQILSLLEQTANLARADVDALILDCTSDAPLAEWVFDFLETRSSAQIRIVRRDTPEDQIELKIAGVAINTEDPATALQATLISLKERVLEYGQARFLDEIRSAFPDPDRYVELIVTTNRNEHRSRDLDSSTP